AGGGLLCGSGGVERPRVEGGGPAVGAAPGTPPPPLRWRRLLRGVQRRMDVGRYVCSGSARSLHMWWRAPDASRKRFEVLHNSGEVELVAGSREASKSHALEALMRLGVREPPLILLALVARSVELRRAHECAGEIAGNFVDVSCDLAKEHPRAALRLEWACVAIALGRKVAQHVVVTDVARCLEYLSGRADIDVALPVEREVIAGEGAVLPGALVPHRDLRRDAGADQPAEELAGAVGRIGGETLRLEPHSPLGPLDHRSGGADLVVSSRRRG